MDKILLDFAKVFDLVYIEETNLERDLGVTVGSDLKWREHVDRMEGKANRKIGMLKRTFEGREPRL